jgi:drug/metabolite transporter (DMT)-like permease
MHMTSIGLLVVAAIFHAVSQALIKGARSGLVFSWLMLGASTIVGIPALFFLAGISPLGWLIVGASGLLEAAYFMSLTKAYSQGELSSVYPIARGSAPLLTLLWSVLFLGERPSVAGLLGILIIVAGIYLSRLDRLSDWNRPFRNFSRGGAGWALLTGVFISLYTTIDKMGTRHLGPLLYLYLVLAIAWLVQLPFRLRLSGRRAILDEIGERMEGAWRVSVARCLKVAGSMALGFAAYALVLLAMRTSPVSYVAPVREMSVVLGAWIGIRIFKERGGVLRIVAAALILLGIFAIAWRG